MRAKTPSGVLILTLALGVLFGPGEPSRVRAQGAVPPGMTPQGLAQIQALLTEKAARTPAQRKLDSQLLYGAKMSRGQAIASGVQTLGTNLSMTPEGRVVVDVRADVSDALLDRFRALGVGVISASAAYSSARLEATFTQIEEIAAFDEVHFIGPKAEAVTNRVAGAAEGPTLAAAKSIPRPQRRAVDRLALRAAVLRALARQDAATNTGSVTSEGDLTHKAAAARSTYSVDGTGVKIGVLSDGVANLATSQGSGDLGPVTVVSGQTGSGDEGTAMLEIVHDLAPGAQLFFATAFSGITTFADNIRTLRNTYHCDIIIDDVFYYVESPFQDGQASSVASNTNGGVVIQAVKDVTAAGALYFSSAGNGGNLDAGTSGTWEGDFVDGGPTSVEGGCGAGQQDCRLHNFGGGQTYDVLNGSGLGVITLQWSDPLGGATNDYDLFLLNSTGSSVLYSSTNVQSGSQDPFEGFGASGSGFPVGSRVVILKWSGASSFLHLGTARGRLSIATSGETHGHTATTASSSFDVAATPAQSPGPSPNPFSSSNTIETFSSDGPRRIFFNADSSPITPGNFSSTGGQVLQKPDLTAADRVSVSGAGGFGTVFSGTSAAAPHAGAIAALIKSANLSLTAGQVRAALLGSAIDIQAAGIDRDSGVGIVMADTALQSVVPASNPHMGIDSPTAGSSPSVPFQMNGWAVDAGPGTGTGVDAVHVYAYPGSGSPIFLGVASYGSPRSDISGIFGSRFTNSGFSLTITGLSPGAYNLAAFAHSTITGTFNQASTAAITVSPPPALPAMSLDTPSTSSTVYSSMFLAGGWAIDQAAPSGTGVDAVHVWAFVLNGDGSLGSSTFLGVATYGNARSDVGAAYGSRFTNSGFFLNISSLAAGRYRLAVYAHSTYTGSFNQVRAADILVAQSALMSIDVPSDGTTRAQPILISGWALDRAAPSGTGVDAINIWAFPVSGSGGPFFAGSGGYGGARGDVGAAFGAQFANSGYNTYVTGLAIGTYDLVVYARSTVAGTFNQSRVVRVTVN
jgi:hypothetical protein